MASGAIVEDVNVAAAWAEAPWNSCVVIQNVPRVNCLSESEAPPHDWLTAGTAAVGFFLSIVTSSNFPKLLNLIITVAMKLLKTELTTLTITGRL